MRDSPVAVLGFLISMVLLPAVISYVVLWAILHYLNGGILYYRGESTTSAISEETTEVAENRVLQCSYFTGSRVIEREFIHGESDVQDDDMTQKDSCPLWIFVE